MEVNRGGTVLAYLNRGRVRIAGLNPASIHIIAPFTHGFFHMVSEFPARLPSTPYYAVIFSSLRTGMEPAEYAQTADRMLELASQSPGFLGVESVRDADGCGITVSYWATPESIEAWRLHVEHLQAQASGRNRWYERFALRVAEVFRASSLPVS